MCSCPAEGQQHEIINMTYISVPMLNTQKRNKVMCICLDNYCMDNDLVSQV